MREAPVEGLRHDSMNGQSAAAGRRRTDQLTDERTNAAAAADAAAAAAAASAAEDCPLDELAVGIDRRDMELHDGETKARWRMRRA